MVMKINKKSILGIILFSLLFNTILFSQSHEELDNWNKKYDNLLKKYIVSGVKNNIPLALVDYRSLSKDPQIRELKNDLEKLPDPLQYRNEARSC